VSVIKLFPTLSIQTRALLFSDDSCLETCLHTFSEAFAVLDLKLSWSKTKIQNLGAHSSPDDIQIYGNIVESIDKFVNLGSQMTAGDNGRSGMKRRISLTASVIGSLSQIW